MTSKDFVNGFKNASPKINPKYMDDVISNCIRRNSEIHQGADPKYTVSLYTMEEIGELMEAIGQRIRGRVTNNYDVLQEIADVILNILCIGQLMGISGDDIKKAINVKLDREARRIINHDAGQKTY